MTDAARRERKGAADTGASLLEALAAIVILAFGVALLTKVQKSAGRDNLTDSRILMAGKLIEKYLEDTRISITKDTLANWPPSGIAYAAAPPHDIRLGSAMGPAFSPKDGALVADVVKVSITASWDQPYPDSLKVTTYVAKRF